MRSAIAIAALAGAVAALPSFKARDVVVEQDVVVATDVVVVTDTTVVNGAAPTPVAQVAHVAASKPSPVENNPAPAVVTVVVDEASPAPAAAAPPASPAPAAASSPPASSPTQAASSSGSNDGSPQSGNASILSICNKWRSAYGLGTFTWDSSLASNSASTGQYDDGVNENHELLTGSLAQVITPGMDQCGSNTNNCDGLGSPFELAYLGGWMCEIPTDPALGGQCSSWTKAAGMAATTETGHADILKSKAYTKIGCAFTSNGQPEGAQFTGLWICDLA